MLNIFALTLLIAGTYTTIQTQAWRYEQNAKYGGTFVFSSMVADPTTLNPVMSTVTDCHTVAGAIFSSLILADADFNFWPNLAWNWTVSSDAKNYTFKLVQNATWHDGTPFTAADVVFTVNKAWKNSTVCPYSASIFGPISNAEATDNYTVVIRTTQPYAPLITYLSSTAYGAILPAHIYNNTNILTNPANLVPVGTGPFKYQEWVTGDHVTVVRNARYFKAGLPYLNKVVFKIIKDPVAKMNALTVGEIDAMSLGEQTKEKVQQMQQNPSFYITAKRGGALSPLWVLQFNMRESHPPIGGLSENATKVRKALWYATNITFLIENVLTGISQRASSIIPSGLWGFYNVSALYPMPHNVTLARQMLDAAGYPVQGNGWRFELYFPYAAPSEQPMAEYIREAWAQVNVKVNIEGMDRNPKLTKWASGNFDLFFDSPYHGPDASITTGRFYISTNIVGAAYTNCQGYNRTTIDTLFQLAKNTTDLVQRQQVYNQFQQILWNDAPTICIAERLDPGIFRATFQGEPITTWGPDDPLETVYWTQGSSYSPDAALVAINNAKAQIDSYTAQYYHVDAARAKLVDAQTAYTNGDWGGAVTLAQQAATLVTPPYEIYAAIAVVVIIVVGVLIWYMRRGRVKF